MKKLFLFSVIMFTSATSMAENNYEGGVSGQLLDNSSVINSLTNSNDDYEILENGCFLYKNAIMQVC
ncbi:hypothetical protein RF657_10540 [Yersinia rochesterensis]|uniref:hypothetical protein n=1 Tax=Yersinia rochesterensis TaxID=1604335 RepID=UPI00285347D5|nr:hypothetical protein [Yersinia rochesterensis]MDR5018829.1 hypothetical protein [Yersinia rochesterensis]